jgi:hypothetical protein
MRLAQAGIYQFKWFHLLSFRSLQAPIKQKAKKRRYTLSPFCKKNNLIFPGVKSRLKQTSKTRYLSVIIVYFQEYPLFPEQPFLIFLIFDRNRFKAARRVGFNSPGFIDKARKGVFRSGKGLENRGHFGTSRIIRPQTIFRLLNNFV